MLRDEAEAIYATNRQEVWREKTGAPRTATVTALTRLRALEITRDTIDDMLKKNPELFERFSRVLAQRQLEIDALANRRVDKRAVERDILTRMRAFFTRMTSRSTEDAP